MALRLSCFAHRGASGHAPGNTLSAIRKALDMGSDWIEVDVQRSDDELAVIHDRRLPENVAGGGLVTETPWATLRTLDAGQGERIPALREVFACVAGRAGINVELKSAGCVAPVAALIREYGVRFGMQRFLVSSFDHRWLRAMREMVPEIRLGALIAGVPEDLAACGERLGAWSLHSSLEFTDAELLKDAHERGIRVYVYTVNHVEDIARMRDLGVDGVFTDYPDRVVGTRSTT